MDQPSNPISHQNTDDNFWEFLSELDLKKTDRKLNFEARVQRFKTLMAMMEASKQDMPSSAVSNENGDSCCKTLNQQPKIGGKYVVTNI
ncbi:hypothetical protein O181_130333 [Austropuccinia psidii MF-1]|uniref:Uncharacterized protein n=1 Tax=Austropuccinia psidii MF-1 TaxID=1389203 RepID=A0A9Q3KZW4_9BASI|nr:hypothetical protein [Austropuccinia psidii MF-1]